MEKMYDYNFSKMIREGSILRALLFASLLLCQCIANQKVTTPFECSLIDKPIKDFKVDAFGNFYTIERSNRFKLYDPQFNLLFEYFNNGLGEISHVDITNPRKIILFFGGFQKMVFLDNTLSEVGRFGVDFNLPYDIRAIGSSRDNNIWIYDATDYRLKKIDPQGATLLTSNPLESYLELEISPNLIIEYNNEVFIIEEGKGVAVFDNFGNYLRFLALGSAYSFSMIDNSMVYLKGNEILKEQIGNVFSDPMQITTVPSNLRTAYIIKNEVFYLENSCLKKEIIP